LAPPATDSNYISTQDIKNTIETGKCQCEVCKSMAHKYQNNDKPICTIEELKQMQDEDRRAQDNFSKIKIIDNTWAVCQNEKCGVKPLPQTQPLSIHSELHPDKIKERKYKLAAAERSKIKLNTRQIAGLKKAIISRKEKTIEKQSIQKRIPLYRRGEWWVCGNCFV
jgi:hypothetical protein